MNSLSLVSNNLVRVLDSSINATNNNDDYYGSQPGAESITGNPKHDKILTATIILLGICCWIPILSGIFVTIQKLRGCLSYNDRARNTQNDALNSDGEVSSATINQGDHVAHQAIEMSELVAANQNDRLVGQSTELERVINDLQNLIEKNKNGDENKCSICLDNYEPDVIELKCNHTFNISCMEELVRNSAQNINRANNIRSIKCPVCRQITHIPTDNKLQNLEESDL